MQLISQLRSKLQKVQFPYFGRQRFWILYWAYKLTGWHIRHYGWDFVLKYLPKLHNKERQCNLLDVGCSRNLFCHEIKARGYNLAGVEIKDITYGYVNTIYNFVTCISVLEDIDNDQQKKALENMCASLKIGGRLLLTTPTKEFAKGHNGFTWADIASIMPKTMRTIESTERAGQLCMALHKI